MPTNTENSIVQEVGELLHDAAETHHIVFKIVDGDDKDWASWYSEWLLHLSRLPQLLKKEIVRSELTYMLVKLDKDYTEQSPSEAWEQYYARQLIQHFA